MKIASWNVNSLKVRLQHVLDWLESQQPDVLGLQETKTTDENFPQEIFSELGYQVSFAGQKTYNGVAVISKQPIAGVVTDFPGFDDPQRRIMAVTVDGVRVINLYVPNGSSLDSDKYPYKLSWLAALKEYLQQQLVEHEKVVVMGDFNIAPEDCDVYDAKSWKDCVLVSEPERAALQAILDLGFKDSFRLFEQEERSYSWWDYRQMAFRFKKGLRIDLLLVNQMVEDACVASVIDKEPRKLERPSDHAPVYIEIK